MVLAIVLGFIAILVLWLLVAPLSLRIDTYSNEYYIRWWGIGKAEMIFAPDDLIFYLRIGPWSKAFHPLYPGEKTATPKEEKAEKAGKKKRRRKFPLHKIQRILRSFTVKEFRLEIDTNDYVWNAWLFPLVQIIRPVERHVRVNFEGKNDICLVIENQLWKVGWAALR